MLRKYIFLTLRGWLHGEISARRLRYGKEENDLNKKHEVHVEISQVVTNMQHKTNIFRCVFQMNHIYYFFIALHKALSVFHTSCFLFKTFPPSFPSPSSRAEISPCIRPLTTCTCMQKHGQFCSLTTYMLSTSLSRTAVGVGRFIIR